MPEGEDGDTSDVMELVERKDMLEKLLKEAVSQLDCFIYQPLSNFIDLMGNIIDFDETVRFLQRNMRKYLVKMHLNMVSSHFNGFFLKTFCL